MNEICPLCEEESKEGQNDRNYCPAIGCPVGFLDEEPAEIYVE